MRGVRDVVIHALLILLSFSEGSAIHLRTPRVGRPVSVERRADGDVAEERAAMVARQARDECIDATCIVLIYCERCDLLQELLGMHRCPRFHEDLGPRTLHRLGPRLYSPSGYTYKPYNGPQSRPAEPHTPRMHKRAA